MSHKKSMSDPNLRNIKKHVRVTYDEEKMLQDAADELGVPIGTYLRVAGLKVAHERAGNGNGLDHQAVFPKVFAQYFCTAIANQIVSGAIQNEGMEDTVNSLHAKLMQGLGYS